MLLGSSTVVMHTIATAYHLRMSRNPSVERSMEYAMGIIRRSSKVVSPKKGLKKPDKPVLSEGKRRRQNAKKLVAYVKHKLGLSEKFDYDDISDHWETLRSSKAHDARNEQVKDGLKKNTMVPPMRLPSAA